MLLATLATHATSAPLLAATGAAVALAGAAARLTWGRRVAERATAVGDARPRVPSLHLSEARGHGENGASWELAAAGGCDTRRCAAFLDRIEGLDRGAWLELGRRALTAAPASAREAAEATLGGLIAARQLAVTAWLVRDHVETAAQLATAAAPDETGRRHPPPPCSPAEQRALAAARQATECAALAHLVRPWLPRADYLTLLSPFLAVAADDGA